jgi:hypothetical protein
MSADDSHGALVRDGFRCPLCDFDAYCRVLVQRKDFSWYATPFYKCGGCQVMFVNPQTFSATDAAARVRPRRST